MEAEGVEEVLAFQCEDCGTLYPISAEERARACCENEDVFSLAETWCFSCTHCNALYSIRECAVECCADEKEGA